MKEVKCISILQDRQSAKDIPCSTFDFPVSLFCRIGSENYTGVLIFLMSTQQHFKFIWINNIQCKFQTDIFYSGNLIAVTKSFTLNYATHSDCLLEVKLILHSSAEVCQFRNKNINFTVADISIILLG